VCFKKFLLQKFAQLINFFYSVLNKFKEYNRRCIVPFRAIYFERKNLFKINLLYFDTLIDCLKDLCWRDMSTSKFGDVILIRSWIAKAKLNAFFVRQKVASPAAQGFLLEQRWTVRWRKIFVRRSVKSGAFHEMFLIVCSVLPLSNVVYINMFYNAGGIDERQRRQLSVDNVTFLSD